jgi:hypothetical protein
MMNHCCPAKFLTLTMKASTVAGFSPSPLERGWGEVMHVDYGFYVFTGHQ